MLPGLPEAVPAARPAHPTAPQQVQACREENRPSAEYRPGEIHPDGAALRIAAVVVTFNRLGQLRETLQRLLAEPLDHILVVDSGSTDGSREWLATCDDPRLELLFQAENGGGAAGFEAGLRAAVDRFDPDWTVLMDDDARPYPGAVARFRADAAAGGWADTEAVSAGAWLPDGTICEMNRPWVNPFWHWRVFLRVLSGKGRDGFHIAHGDYAATAPVPIDGTSFVGLFLARDATRLGGYPDGRLFIYGDDVLYTLGLTRAGGRIVFAPWIGFEHDCTTQARGAIFRPLWKTYYHHRNLWFVYRRAAGPWLFWPLIAVMAPKWMLKGGALPAPERRIYRRLIRLAIRDAARNRRNRPHAEIRAIGG